MPSNRSGVGSSKSAAFGSAEVRLGACVRLCMPRKHARHFTAVSTPDPLAREARWCIWVGSARCGAIARCSGAARAEVGGSCNLCPKRSTHCWRTRGANASGSGNSGGGGGGGGGARHGRRSRAELACDRSGGWHHRYQRVRNCHVRVCLFVSHRNELSRLFAPVGCVMLEAVALEVDGFACAVAAPTPLACKNIALL
jgi:hypothetical protein